MENLSSQSGNNLPDSSLEKSVLVIYGPRTRIAQAVLQRNEITNGKTLVLVARHDAEADEMRQKYPLSIIADRCDVIKLLAPARSVTILCCAAGPIHVPDAGFRSEKPDSFEDVKSIENIINFYRNADLNFILISSVLALSPNRNRSAYAGWKLYLEGTISQHLQQCSSSRLQILYPGRLIGKKTFTNPPSICYSTFDFVAACISIADSQVQSSRRLIGLDARIWLLINRVLALLKYLVGRY